MNLNKKLCEIIDTDSGFDNQEMADKIENLFNRELLKYKNKAEKWDKLGEKISTYYEDEESEGDLGDIGEIAAIAFGYL